MVLQATRRVSNQSAQNKKNNKIATDKDDDARKKNVSVLFTLPFGFRIQIYGRSQEKSDPALRYSPEWVGLAESINSITPLPVRLLLSRQHPACSFIQRSEKIGKKKTPEN